MEFVLGLVVVALVAYAIVRGAGKSDGNPSPPAVVARIRGNGKFAGEVVGESHYKAAFQRLLGESAFSDEERFCDALLRLEDDNAHDANAVGVYLEGVKVGHLGRADARDFRAALKRDGLGDRRELAVAARVYCGGEEGHFSVQLDLPKD